MMGTKIKKKFNLALRTEWQRRVFFKLLLDISIVLRLEVNALKMSFPSTTTAADIIRNSNVIFTSITTFP